MSVIDSLIETYGGVAILVVIFGYFIGGFVKGAIGTALPVVAVSISAIVLPAPVAVALIASAGVATNAWQGFRDGIGQARVTVQRFFIMLGTIMITIWFVASLVPVIDKRLLLVFLGCLTIAFSTIQLVGWRPVIRPAYERPAQFFGGLFGGITGGLSGVWGPPVLMVLLALNLPKAEHIRAAGLCWMIGALPFFFSHWYSGLLTGETLALSLALIAPAALGIALGVRVQSRLAQDTFRHITLIVLCVIGAVLLWRAARMGAADSGM